MMEREAKKGKKILFHLLENIEKLLSFTFKIANRFQLMENCFHNRIQRNRRNGRPEVTMTFRVSPWFSYNEIR